MAAALRAQVGTRGVRVDLQDCCSLLKAEVREARLGSATGGCQALLVPLPDDRFRIVVDTAFRVPDVADAATRKTARHRRRFRVAHELGHVGFYRRNGGRPWRGTPGGTRAEEDYCDAFAQALLAPAPPVQLDACGILRYQKACDVSLEVAARAAAAGHESPRIGLWWWKPPERGKRAPLLEQWTNDASFMGELALVPYKTDAHDLSALLHAARGRLGGRLTVEVLPRRRQALAVLSTS